MAVTGPELALILDRHLVIRVGAIVELFPLAFRHAGQHATHRSKKAFGGFMIAKGTNGTIGQDPVFHYFSPPASVFRSSRLLTFCVLITRPSLS